MDYKTLIIDGNNFLYRAYYAKRPEIIVNGVNTTPIHQFLYMLKVLREQFPKIEDVYFTWDKRLNHEGSNFRKALTAYKEHRVETDDTRSIWSYCELLQPIIDALGIYTIFPYSLEGDDVMNFIAKKSLKSIIISSDKDLLQLISPNTHVYNPTKREIITDENFEEKIGMRIDQFVIYKSIFGDIADNIPGLDGYGKVKAGRLSKAIVEQYSREWKDDMLQEMALVGQTETIDLNELGISKEQYDIICHNVKIGWLDYVKHVPSLNSEWESYEKQYQESRGNSFDADKVKAYFSKYNFVNYIREFGTWSSMFNKSPTTELDFDELLKLI